MERGLQELLERGVTALEKLAEDEIEIRLETKPPVCPHCETMNPKVRVGEFSREGPLAEYAFQAQCLHCNKVMIVIPFQIECVKTVEEANIVLDEKMRLGGYETGNSGTPVGSDAARAGGV